MEKDKVSENVEFDVIYADGTRRHVHEGVLFGVEEETMTFHKGTSHGVVLFGAVELALFLIDSIGLTKIFREYIRGDSADEAVLQIVNQLADLQADISSAEKQAVFRLGQMDMRESAIAMLQEAADGYSGVVGATLRAAADLVKDMEVL